MPKFPDVGFEGILDVGHAMVLKARFTKVQLLPKLHHRDVTEIGCVEQALGQVVEILRGLTMP